MNVTIVFIFFILVLAIGYLVLSKHSSKGTDEDEKFLPYTGGQSLPPREARLSYQDFFRIGLLFGILHVSALVISTMPLSWENHKIGLVYIIGVGISASVLSNTKSR